MRIVSLLSSATEILYELGLQDHLVGISHECDYPPEALRLPRVSRPRFDPQGLDSAAIDAEVRRCMVEYGSVYQVDTDRLRELQPDLILTQAVCEVCAVPTGSVEDAVAQLSPRPEVLSLDAHTLDGIFHTVQQVADAAGAHRKGREVVADLRARLERLREKAADRARPRVLLLEWLDPPFAPGHWVPEMVDWAGGENLLGEAGAPSRQIAWSDLEGLRPDRLVIVPCGYDLNQTRADAAQHREKLQRIALQTRASGEAWLGHSAFFSRSGPRVVEGIEALSRIFYPDVFPEIPLEGRVERWI